MLDVDDEARREVRWPRPTTPVVLWIKPSYTAQDPGWWTSDRSSGREQDEQLRAWGAGLVADGNYELRATGKAILLLIEEIERLHVDLWNAKTTQEQDQPVHAGGDHEVQASLDRTLRARLSRVRGQ